MSEGADRPLPQFPGGPDPKLPVPRDPVHGVDLRGCAAIAAELAARREPRRAVLARFRLDEARWTDIEQTWMLRVATAALTGDLSFSVEYDAGFSAAQDALGGAEVSLDTYAAVNARIEAGQAPDLAMRAENVQPADFARAQRKWAAELAGSPPLHADFRAKVAERRAKLG
jgi:hypothetical protein